MNNLPSFSHHTQQRGFSLVEIMVVVGLSVSLLAGIIQVLSGSQQNYQSGDAQSQVLESGQFAMSQLSSVLRLRGFEGCSNPMQHPETDTTLIFQSVPQPFFLGNIATDSLLGFTIDNSNTWTPARPNNSYWNNLIGSNFTPRANSDVISVYYAGDQAAQLLTDVDMTAETLIKTTPLPKFDTHQWLVMSDCGKLPDTLLLKSTSDVSISTDPMTGITTQKIPFWDPSSDVRETSRIFRADQAQIRQAFVDVFYVANTGRTAQGGAPIYALYRYRNGGSPEELVEGIEFLKIEYGEVLPGGQVRYVRANNATPPNMANVKSLRIGLLAASTTTALPADDTKHYALPGGEIAPNDYITEGNPSSGRLLRRAFTMTVQLKTEI